MRKSKYTVVSLFSGALGLDLGLLKTGRFRVLACIEKEKVFCDTIRANIKAGNLPDEPLVYEKDIQSLSPQTILDDIGFSPGEIDLIIGGPPCQSFSTAGKRGTVQDPRGTLLWEYLRYVKEMKPKVFLMENVRGLLSAAILHRPIAERPPKNGSPLTQDEVPGSVVRLYAEDLQSFSDAPYHMDCYEVNAVNYGAPQLRERALFIGNRYNKEVIFPDPNHGHKDGNDKDKRTLFSASNRDISPWRTLGDAIGDINEQEAVLLDFSPRKKKYLSLVPPGGNWRHLPLELQEESLGRAFYAKGGRSGWWRRLSFDLPCPTLVTMPNHASTSLCHPSEVRALSLKEYLRIQEFPDNWIVCGSPSEQYRQIGNAVPTRLGEVAGNVIASTLDEINKSGNTPNMGPPLPYRRVYIQSHVRTRVWFKNGVAMRWQDGLDNEDIAYSLPKTKRKWSIMEQEGNNIEKPRPAKDR